MFNFWNWDKMPELVGIYKGQYKNIGQFKRNVFVFELENGNVYHCWSLIQLGYALSGIPFGTKVKITYTGMKIVEGTSHPSKTFTVDILEPLGGEKAELKSD